MMWMLLLACTLSPPDGGARIGGEFDWVPPPVDELPEQVEPPDAFTSFFDGFPIEDAGTWEVLRRRELDLLMAHYVYGEQPELPAADAVVGAIHEDALDGTAELVEIELGDLDVLLVRPAGVATPPVLVGVNKCGNHSLLEDVRVPLATAFVQDDCPTERGGRAETWDLEAMVAAGWAVATVHQSELAPDDEEHVDDGLVPVLDDDSERPAGAVAAWSAGLSHVASTLEREGLADPDRIGVFGHSRRGKAALLAASRDEELDFVWAHQSGTFGATLSRSQNGESVGAITTLFPHWFTPRAAEFANRETLLPFDQHLLLAMVAPRPVLVTDGTDDLWADPEGATAAVELAQEVYRFLEADEAHLARELRPGEHEVTEEDWALFLQFAAEQLD